MPRSARPQPCIGTSQAVDTSAAEPAKADPSAKPLSSRVAPAPAGGQAAAQSTAQPPAERPAPPAAAVAMAAPRRADAASAPAANDDIFKQYWKSR
jgi:hypothetical protein